MECRAHGAVRPTRHHRRILELRDTHAPKPPEALQLRFTGPGAVDAFGTVLHHRQYRFFQRRARGERAAQQWIGADLPAEEVRLRCFGWTARSTPSTIRRGVLH